MRNIQLLIAFDGTAYKGWQRQKNAPTIQGTIEKKLARLCNEPILVHGAGRTDAGVHALGMVAHFHTTVSHPLTTFSRGLNSMLPNDIRIVKAMEMAENFHSRYDAVGKTYRYNFSTAKLMLPTRRLYEAHLPGPFDLKSCQECLKSITGTHDFTSFEATGSRDKTQKKGRGAVRTIVQAQCSPIQGEPEHWSCTISGDGFLRHMVRNIIGTLREIGSGKKSVQDFSAIVTARNRHHAGPTAPACGLFLERIYYSASEIPTATSND